MKTISKLGLLLLLTSFMTANVYAASSKSIVDRIAKEHEVSREEASKRVNQVFSAISKELQSGREVGIRGFGTFWLQEREAREGRNPKSGKKMQIPAKRYPKFRSSDSLKKAVN